MLKIAEIINVRIYHAVNIPNHDIGVGSNNSFKGLIFRKLLSGSSFFQKVLRPFLAKYWASRGSVVTITIILVG